MPTPTLTVGAPCWVDLYSSDVERAKTFYGELFGWAAEASAPELGGYFVFTKDGRSVAGCMPNDGAQGYPDGWTIHLLTDDAERTAAAARANGGVVHFDPMQVAENGVTTMIGDPGGATVGAWQPGAQRGFDVIGEPGAPSWFELHTNAYDACVDFYRDVFGWDARTMSDAPEFRYTTLGEGDDARAGILDASALSDGSPASWTVYFGVDDADAALEQVAALDGRVVRPAEDTPYGRLAQAADPTGALFRIVAG